MVAPDRTRALLTRSRRLRPRGARARADLVNSDDRAGRRRAGGRRLAEKSTPTPACVTPPAVRHLPGNVSADFVTPRPIDPFAASKPAPLSPSGRDGKK